MQEIIEKDSDEVEQSGLTAVGHLSINKYIRDEISIHFL